MCQSMVDIQSATAEIRRGKKKERKKERERKKQNKNIMYASATQGGHKYPRRYITLWNINVRKQVAVSNRYCD